MKTKDIIEGMSILLRYYTDREFHTGAGHDVIYMYATDLPVSLEDLTRLVELGWFQEDATQADPDGDYQVSDYDEGEGWVAYV